MASNNHSASGIIAQFGKHVLPWVGDDPVRARITRQVMQDLVAGKFSVTPVSILSPALQAQVDKVQEFLRLYGGEPGFRPEDAALAQPLVGVPEDEQLLAVYLPHGSDGRYGFFRTLDAWFTFAGRERLVECDSRLKSEPTVMRLTTEYQPGIRWVRFRKNHDAGKSSTYSRERVVGLNGQLGGLEPLMAVSLLEGYFDGWFGGGNVAPNLAAIEVSLDGGLSWGRVAFLGRWSDDGGRRELRLGVSSADDALPLWGCPLVSEC